MIVRCKTVMMIHQLLNMNVLMTMPGRRVLCRFCMELCSWSTAMVYPFTGQSGLSVDMTNFSPDEYYQLFVSDDLLNRFAIQANLFAEQYIDENPNLPSYCNDRQWVLTAEMRWKNVLACYLWWVLWRSRHWLFTGQLIRCSKRHFSVL